VKKNGLIGERVVVRRREKRLSTNGKDRLIAIELQAGLRNRKGEKKDNVLRKHKTGSVNVSYDCHETKTGRRNFASENKVERSYTGGTLDRTNFTGGA